MYTHRKEVHLKTEAEMRVVPPQPRNTGSYPKLEEARQDPSLEPLEGPGPGATLFWTSGFQNNERINLCCLKPPSLQ